MTVLGALAMLLALLCCYWGALVLDAGHIAGIGLVLVAVLLWVLALPRIPV